MNGYARPGEITNFFLLMDSKDFYHNWNNEKDFANFPIKESMLPDRDYIMVPAAIWTFLSKEYKGFEIKRYSVKSDKLSRLHRDPMLPKLRIALLRSGDKVKHPK